MSSEEIGNITLEIVSHVSNENKYYPLTGLYSIEENIPGWKWDIRFPESRNIPSTRGDFWIGGHEVGLKDGTQKTHWQSGTIEGIDFKDVIETYDNSFAAWTPVVSTGKYSVYFDQIDLYSDFSFCGRVDVNQNENGVNTFSLRGDAFLSTISCNIYERDSEFVRRPKVKFEAVQEFTGIIEDDLRVSTVDDDGNILWDKLETRKNEFLVSDGKIYFNNDYQIKIGYVDAPLSKEVLAEFYEYKGVGNSGGRLAFTNYFPLGEASTEVYILSSTGAIKQLTEVDNLNFSGENDEHYSVDYDLGIFSLGGYSAPDLVLTEGLTEDDTVVKVQIDDDSMDSYPEQGIITINGEKILYYGKGRTEFYDCVRGYDGTAVSSHAKFSTVSDIQHGKAILDSEKIYIKYIAVPRVDYEVTSYDHRTSNSIKMLDVKAISNIESNNIIQISTVEPNLATVELEIDKDFIGGIVYGPLFYGTDIAKLTARALDSRDNPVEDIELTIVLEGQTGALNGSLSQYSSLSNSYGEIYAFYNAPYDEDSVLKEIGTVKHSGSSTIMELKEEVPVDTSNKSITLYQVLKHDGVYGTTGVKLVATEAENNPVFADNPGLDIGPCTVGTTAYFEDAISRFDNAIAYVDVDVGGSSVRYKRRVIGVIDHFDRDIAAPAGSQFERGDLIKITFILDSPIPTLDTGGVAECISLIQRGPSDEPKFELLPTGEQEWNPAFLDGVKVLVYEWLEEKGGQTIIHPITGEIGAYYPVRPDVVSPTSLTFLNRNLPIPDRLDDSNNLGGYYVIAPSIVSFYAWGRDPITGRIVKSNTIKLKLVLPVYLDGVKDPEGALPVPYGFTFITEDFNVGTGLGGANFITVNSARAPLYIDAEPPISDTGANSLPIQLKVGF